MIGNIKSAHKLRSRSVLLILLAKHFEYCLLRMLLSFELRIHCLLDGDVVYAAFVRGKAL